MISGQVHICAWCRPGIAGLESVQRDYPHIPSDLLTTASHDICREHKRAFVAQVKQEISARSGKQTASGRSPVIVSSKLP